MKSVKAIAVLFILFLSFTAIYGTGDETALSFESYMSVISNKLPEIQLNRITTEKASNTYRQSRASGDTAVKADAQAYRQYSADSTALNIDSITGYEISASAEKTLLLTGTKLGIEFTYQNALTSGTALTSPYNAVNLASYSPSVTFSVSQPLLNNIFGYATRQTVNNARMLYEIQKLQREIDDRDALNSYRVIYFQWIQLRKNLKYLEQSITNARTMEKQSREKLNVGLIDNDDYQSSKSLVIRYQESYANSDLSCKNIIYSMADFFDAEHSAPDETAWDSFLDNATNAKTPWVEFESTDNARILRQTKSRLEEAVDLYRNQTLPDLSLVGSVTFSGTDSNNISSAVSKFGAHPVGSIGLQLAFPLEANDSVGKLKNAELSLESWDYEYQQTKNSYDAKLKYYIEEIAATKRLIGHKTENLAALRSKYETQKRKHNQGRVTLSDLIDTEISIASEQINQIALQYILIADYFNYLTLTAVSVK